MSAPRVAVVVGGPSVEAEVSRTGGRAVRAALENAGHLATLVELDAALADTLKRDGFDVVFPVVHGALGEDGSLQGLLEVLGIPYVGSGVLASALATSKVHAKLAFRAAGLPVAPEATIRAGEPLLERIRGVRSELGRALVIKPASGGSAIGVEMVRDSTSDSDAGAAVARVLALDPVALVEPFVEGREVTCGVLERDGLADALPITLIEPVSDYYDFQSKYRAGGSRHQCPAPFDPELTRRVQAAAVTAHRSLGCRDLSRTDFLVDAERGRFVVLETNTLPGMTPTSLFPEAALAVGMGFEALCSGLVRTALSRPGRARVAAPAMP